MSDKQNIREEITNNIIAMMEKNTGEWIKPFAGLAARPMNPKTEKNYSGLNAFYLSLLGNSYWATFNQWKEIGAKIKKGSKATRVMRPQAITKKDANGKPEMDSEGNPKKFTIYKAYPVFSADQVEGWDAPELPNISNVQRIENADKYLRNLGSVINFTDAGQAFYDRSNDQITLPKECLFNDTEGFYSTWCHEEIHKTGAPNRLNRIKGKKFGDRDYAFEELVAEIGAAMLCVQLRVTPTVRQDHAEYIGSWLKALRNDKKYLADAATLAGEAIDFMDAQQTNRAAA